MFDGRGLKIRHRIALAIFRFTLDRFENMALFGDLGLVAFLRGKAGFPWSR
jgi:hypothetical protein